ncbi:MAG: hypothetical protein WAL59_18485 [Roseiarcus sp.]
MTGLPTWRRWSWRSAGKRRIIVPRPQRLERILRRGTSPGTAGGSAPVDGRLTADQRRQLDALPGRRENINQSWLAWLRQMPEAAKPVAMLGLIEHLKRVSAIGLDPTRGDGDTSGVSLDRRFHGYSLSEIRNPCYALNHDGPNGNRTKRISRRSDEASWAARTAKNLEADTFGLEPL